MAVVRGDYDVSADKLTALIGTGVRKLAGEKVLKRFNLHPGYNISGPCPRRYPCNCG